MSKRNSDGDVLSNITAVLSAKEQNQITSLLGGVAYTSSTNEPSAENDQDSDLGEKYVEDETFGIGAIIPEDIQDGSFTRRIPGSTDDKLLQTLLGNKAAKAHLERQKNSKINAGKPQTQAPSKPQRNIVKAESEDEEEGRSSMFTSKRRKVVKAKPQPESDEDEDDEAKGTAKLPLKDEEKKEILGKRNSDDDESGDETVRKAVPKSRPQKVKKASYLDELLAERSAKKKKKSKVKGGA